MDDDVKALNQKRINHLSNVLTKLNETNPNFCTWILTNTENMNFKDEYGDKNA